MKMTLFAALFLFSTALAQAAETHMIQEDAVEINGAKFWFPSEIIVKKGDTVKIHAVSKIPGANPTHGFAIDAYKIQEVVDAKGKDIEFVADKAGIFPIRCQLHPAHVGGQLVVLDN
jgi:nitrosocyanin